MDHPEDPVKVAATYFKNQCMEELLTTVDWIGGDEESSEEEDEDWEETRKECYGKYEQARRRRREVRESWLKCRGAEQVTKDVLAELRAMRKGDGYGDYERGHYEADRALCDLLTVLGYDEIVEAYRQVGKWYA